MPYLSPDVTGMEAPLRRFGAELRRCRHNAKMTQDRLAERSGVAQSTISRIERGRAPNAAVWKVVRLAEALGHRFPLAYCPHEHHCVWQRLDADGRPPESPVDDAREAMWRRIMAYKE